MAGRPRRRARMLRNGERTVTCACGTTFTASTLGRTPMCPGCALAAKRRNNLATKARKREAAGPRKKWVPPQVTVPCSLGCGRTHTLDARFASSAVCDRCQADRENLRKRKARLASTRRPVAQRCACGQGFPVPPTGAIPTLCPDCRRSPRKRKPRTEARPALTHGRPQTLDERASEFLAQAGEQGAEPERRTVRCVTCGDPTPWTPATKRCPSCSRKVNEASNQKSRDKRLGERKRKGRACSTCGLPFRPALVDGVAATTTCAVCEMEGTPLRGPAREKLASAALQLRMSRALSVAPVPPSGQCVVCGAPSSTWWCSKPHMRVGNKLRLAALEAQADLAHVTRPSGPSEVFDPEIGGRSGKGAFRPFRPNPRRPTWAR